VSAHAARSIIPYGTRSVKNNLKKVSDFYAAQLQQPHADKAAGKPEGEPGGHIPDMVHAGEHPHYGNEQGDDDHAPADSRVKIQPHHGQHSGAERMPGREGPAVGVLLDQRGETRLVVGAGAVEPGTERGTVLEHCRRALMHVLARGVGTHGLLRIGTGDWNDAFDRVGAQGRGESVWLTWFFAVTARKFAALVGGHAAEQLCLAADHCTRAAEDAWDGAWYRRGYYDDGRPLGSGESNECRIDAIAQAFAALDTHADRGRVHTALTSAVEQLFDREHNVVRLFDPPITRRTPETGYVRSYGAGLRENGGQYTHGALWLAMALLRTGRTAEGAEILHAVLPTAHDPARYEGEPFVLAADIAGGDNAGAAGWTWYTGAAGWYLRIAAEDLLGLHLRGGVLYPEPHLPAGWPECTVRWRDGAGLLHTIRLRPDGVTVDNAPYDGGGIGKKRPKPYSQDR